MKARSNHAEVLETEIEPEKQRRCLSCATAFASVWAGERICKRCKQSSAWRSGISYKPARKD